MGADMPMLESQIVLVTGASGGLGADIAKAFLKAGAWVVGSSRKIADSDFPDPRFMGIPADLTNADEARKLADAMIERFQKMDALVHVTGGFAGGRPVHETDDATWDGMMNLNLRAAFYTLRAAIPHMRKEGRGRIVAIGSRAALEPQAGVGAYSASKAALVSLVRTVALENRDAGITANAILPGTIDTEANRQSDPGGDHTRWVSPARLADLAVFLTSDDAAEITGAAIPVYGAGI